MYINPLRASWLTSPVMATSVRDGTPVATERNEVTIVTPAEGPSLGVAPSGTCRWRALLSRKSLSGCCTRRKFRAKVCAI